MKNLIHPSKALLFLFAFFITISTSCSEDDDEEFSPNGDDYFISFNISGDVTGELEGSAVMTQVELAGNYTLSISGNDFEVEGEEENQTFNIHFRRGPAPNEFESPEVGTYIIGLPAEAAAENGFWVNYFDIDGGSSTEYGTEDVSGTIEITNVTDDYIEGTFDFTAGRTENDQNITVTNGIFKARNGL
ncbi:MAG: hypothetical protein JJU02_14235 [Cryomorphaceae bacterium]|nr:hypothetical protein [Cryomorphaceae bacterium]